MFSRRRFGMLAGAGALLPYAARAAEPAGSRAEEAAAFIAFAEATHPRGLEAKADPAWRALAARLVESAQGAPTADYVVRAYRLLAWFKDGHTTLWASQLRAGPFGLDLPLRAAAFYDGLHVVEAEPAHRDLLGARIGGVGALPTQELIRRFAAIWPANNIAWPHHDAGLLLATPGFLHGLGAVDGPDAAAVPIQAQRDGGRVVRRELVPGKAAERLKLARTGWPHEAWAREAGSGNFVRRLPERGALYVSLDDIAQPIAPFMAFTRQVAEAMAEPSWSKLVLDLRRNPGGNNFLGEPLRKHIERSRFNRPGGLYVLIGPATFSAAQNLVNRLERETFAIFAGEPTGGAPNHYGDARRFEAGVVLQGAVSTLPWFDSYPMDKRPWVMPDLLIPRTFADWRDGSDRVLEAVLAHETTAAADDLSRERVFYYDRPSQSAAWRPFWAP
jgi:hypothetical protein